MALRAYCDKCDAPGDLRWLPGAQHDWGVELFLSWEGKQCSTQTVCKNCMSEILMRTLRAGFKDTTVVQDFEDKLRSLDLLPKLQKSLAERVSERDDARAKHEFDQKNFKSKAEAWDEERRTFEQQALDAANALAELKAKLKAATSERAHFAEVAGRVRIDDAALAADRSALEAKIEAERRKAKELESTLAAAENRIKDAERKRQDLLEAAQRSQVEAEASAATRVAQARRIKEVETALADANGRIQQFEKFKQAVEQQAQKNSVDAAAAAAEKDQAQLRVIAANAERKRAEDALQASDMEKSRLVVAIAALEKRATNSETAAKLTAVKLQEALKPRSDERGPSPAPQQQPAPDNRLANIQVLADQLQERLRDEQQRADKLQKDLKSAQDAVAGAAWTKEKEQLTAQLKAAQDAQALADVKAQNAVRNADERVRRAVAEARQAAAEDPAYLDSVRRREAKRLT
jgi:hypothetical protein